MSESTPAPLTDEQIEAARDALRDAWYSSPDERIPDRPFSLWLAAVIAKAKREAAGEIAREIEREATSLDHLPPTDDPGVADYRMGLRHGMAGSAEHDLVGAAGIARQIGANHA